MKPKNGFTLVELLTVVAICGLLGAFLFGAGVGVYRDYENNLAIEKAYADLQHLELLRRSYSRSDGFIGQDAISFEELSARYGDDNGFIQVMNRFDETDDIVRIDSEYASYRIDALVTSINLTIRVSDDLENTNIVETAPIDEATNLYPGSKTEYFENTDTSESFLEATIYHREVDPLISSYVLDTLTQR